MARIAIVGVGAIGAVVAALLQSIEQHELILCTRRPLPHLNVETPEYRDYPLDSVNSLLADRLAGRPMETDARIGAIVRYGSQHNIPTPLNSLLLSLLEAI